MRGIMNGEKFYWFSQPIFSYHEPNTSITFSISLEGSMQNGTRPNHHTLKICFQLLDKRVAQNRIKVELEYSQLDSLVKQLLHIFKNGFINFCKRNDQIIVKRFTYRGSKHLILDFTLDSSGKELCALKLIDSSQDKSKEIEIYLSMVHISNITEILRDTKKEYSLISMVMFNGLRQERQLALLKETFENWLPQIKNIISTKMNPSILNTHEANDDHITNKSDNEVFNENDVDINSDNTIQSGFDSLITDTGGFCDIQLDMPKTIYETREEELSTKKRLIDKPNNPFIDHFLNGDFSNLIEYTTSIYSLGENSNVLSFLPLHNILLSSTISKEVISEFLDNSYNIQYGLLFYIKSVIRKSIQGKCSISTTTPPVLIFSKRISRKENVLFHACKGMIITLIVYSLLIKRLQQLQLGSHLNTELEEIFRASFIYKTLISPFLFSSEFDKDIFNEIDSEFQQLLKAGILDGLESRYSSLVIGGKFHIPIEGFQKRLENFINIIKSQPQLVEIGNKGQEDKLFKLHNIPKIEKEINSSDGIRKYVFESLRRTSK